MPTKKATKSAAYKPCKRCKDTGYIEQFKHFKGGICFACDSHAMRPAPWAPPPVKTAADHEADLAAAYAATMADPVAKAHHESLLALLGFAA